MLHAYFGPIPNPFCFAGTAEVLEGTRSVLTGWEVRTEASPGIAAGGPGQAVLTVERDGDGYKVTTAEGRLSDLPQTLVEAISGVAAHVVKQLYLGRRDRVPLHCGSFVMNGLLLAISGPGGMGKSTLTSRMCAEEDVVVFGDDILLVDAECQASGVGVLPRLRPPLPVSAQPRFRSFVEGSRAPGDAVYQYVSCPRLAPLDTRAPLTALVILRRFRSVERPYFVELSMQDAFREWIGASIAANCDSMSANVERLEQLCARVPCYKLVYSDLEQAVDLFRESCGEGFAPARLGEEPKERLDLSEIWQRDPLVKEKRIFGGTFLFRDDHKQVIQINETTAFILKMVEEGCTFPEMLEIMEEVYPAMERTVLRADTIAALSELARGDIIIPAA